MKTPTLFLLFLLACAAARGDSPETAVPGEWILTAPRPPAEWDRTLEGTGMTLVRVLDRGRSALVRGPRPPALSRGWKVQRNFIYRALEADPDFDQSWGLHNFGQPADDLPGGTPGVDVGALKAWDIHSGSRSVVVAVLDSGVDLRHEDLTGNLWTHPGELPGNGRDDDGNGFVDDVHGWNFVDGDADISDTNGHGTLCAGIIGARAGNGKGTRGINDAVSLMPLKTLDGLGVGDTAAAIAAIDYAIAQGAHVINASWGGTEYDEALFEAVKRAGEAGILFVAAAGNSARDNDEPGSATYPAAFSLPALISVAAYDNRDRLAAFSNYGKATVHLGAPAPGSEGVDPCGRATGNGPSLWPRGGAAI